MYIKTFESFSESIEDICREYNIENYTINQDGSIDVDGDVNLSYKELTKLPLRFGKVGGGFNCSHNKLTSLEGSPKEVGGYFYCEYNQLTSLEGSPNKVGGDFSCHYNKLTNLEGSPNRVGGDFNCSNNQLTNLEGSPDVVGGDFYCSRNQLTSLEGSPDRIGGDFNCKQRKNWRDNPIYNIYKLFNDKSKIELFNDYDIIRDNGKSIVLDRLNAFLDDIGKSPVDSVNGYKNI